MSIKSLTPIEALFPDGRIYEHFLQRLRLVASQKVLVLKVHAIRDVADSVADLPCIEVVLRIPGLKISNPVTGKQMISTDWLRKWLESPATQRAYLDAFSAYLAATIPDDHPEAQLKRKFKHYRDGVPGDLPTRADLYVEYQELVRHLRDVQKWFRGRKRLRRDTSKEDQAAFLQTISDPIFWWAKYFKQGDITLEMICAESPLTTAKHVLALKYAKSYETVRLRLSRREV